MDHVVYLDAQAKELDNLLSGYKTMIVRGAAERKPPHGRVKQGDTLYFINKKNDGVIQVKGHVKNVFHSGRLSEEESIKLVARSQDQLHLTPKQFDRWAGKRYLVMIEVTNITPVAPFRIHKNKPDNGDDWLTLDYIQRVMLF